MKLSGLSDFGKFLTRHASELSTGAGVLRSVVNALPIGREEKAVMLDGLNRLDMAAESIAESAPKAKEVKVTVRKSDVEEAIAKLLPGIVATELKRLGVTEAAQTGNADGANG